jgi:putative DNA primase/helicase
MTSQGSPGSSRIPTDLIALQQWVAWRTEIREGQPTKVPINARTGRLASSTDSSTWASYQDAERALARFSCSGVGVVFSETDGHTGVDLDDCRNPDTGNIANWAQAIIDELNSYTEVSPSGAGVKIWIRGKLPAGVRNRKKYADGEVEIYSRGRYFTVTGQHLPETPFEIHDRQNELNALHRRIFEDKNSRPVERRQQPTSALTITDQELIERAKRARNGVKFERLWSGDASDYDDDESRADMALCCELAFWTGNNAARMDSLFRQSGLMREKWERDDYRERTISAAIELTHDVWQGGDGGERNRAEMREPDAARVELEQGAAEQESGPITLPGLLGYLHNDHGNAERLIAMHGDDLRYCHEFRGWMVWDGTRWSRDNIDRARYLAKRTMLEFLRQTVKRGADEQAEKFARSCLDSKRIASMLSMAEPEIFVQAADLDTHPFLLNFRNGTVDLRTGELKKHDRLDFITKVIHYDYRRDATCPLWNAFLDRIMGGGPDASEGELERAQRLTNYLQRALGYSLTASTREKAVFLLFGEGDNGKSTLLSTFRKIVEEYASFLLVETLMVRQESNNSQADLADLRGARFVQTSETEEGQRLSQGKLKRITQGMGKIKACRKYENPIEFSESHKLWVDTNSKPLITNADDRATFNRLHPIPFLVSIPKDQIDKEMPDKLLREAEGIISWAVEGARLWYEFGLNKPTEVEAANAKYRSDMDKIGRFIEERCVTGEGFRVSGAALYSEYRRWVEANGEHPLTGTAFGTRISTKEFDKKTTSRGIDYVGIGLRSDAACGDARQVE